MGSRGLNGPKRFLGVNIYVLNKMPNDCTAPAFKVPLDVQSLLEFRDPILTL